MNEIGVVAWNFDDDYYYYSFVCDAHFDGLERCSPLSLLPWIFQIDTCTCEMCACDCLHKCTLPLCLICPYEFMLLLSALIYVISPYTRFVVAIHLFDWWYFRPNVSISLHSIVYWLDVTKTTSLFFALHFVDFESKWVDDTHLHTVHSVFARYGGTADVFRSHGR